MAQYCLELQSRRGIETHRTRETGTSENGSFMLSYLPPGDYEIEAVAPGLGKETVKLRLSIGTTSRVNFALPAEGSDTVVTQAESVSVESSTERATNIDTERIANLPINRRNSLDFTL